MKLLFRLVIALAGVTFTLVAGRGFDELGTGGNWAPVMILGGVAGMITCMHLLFRRY